jgi:hypothetical protein
MKLTRRQRREKNGTSKKVRKPRRNPLIKRVGEGLGREIREIVKEQRQWRRRGPSVCERYLAKLVADSNKPAERHNFFNKPSPTSFGSRRLRPLWQSVLCDLAYILTIGLYKP